MGNRIILHPADWQVLQTEIAKEGSVLFPPAPSGPSTLWGLPVVVSNEVPAGQVIPGDLSSSLNLIASQCECCGSTAEKDRVPICACYLKTAGEQPILCSHCGRCEVHHKDIPFGVCAKPEIVQNVVRTRSRERARRKASGAE